MLLPLSARHAVRRGVDAFGEHTSSVRMLPDYLIVGAMKGGTSALYEYLVRHPLVHRSTNEEVHYFSLHYQRGLDWYRGHFPTRMRAKYVRLREGADLVTGESTPYYMFHPHALERIRGTVPDAKLMVVLRDPVTRAYSHYNHARQMGVEDIPSFEEALDAEPERLAGEEERMRQDPTYNSPAHWHNSYLSRGLYLDQVKRLFSLFPEQQVLILSAEEMTRNPERVHAKALDFLGLPPVSYSKYPRHNSRRYPPIPAAARSRLVEYFAEPNRRLYEFLDTDFGWARP
jgi:Sulfotransferase domain